MQESSILSLFSAYRWDINAPFNGDDSRLLQRNLQTHPSVSSHVFTSPQCAATWKPETAFLPPAISLSIYSLLKRLRKPSSKPPCHDEGSPTWHVLHAFMTSVFLLWSIFLLKSHSWKPRMDRGKVLSPLQVEGWEAGWKRTRVTLGKILFLSHFLLGKVCRGASAPLIEELEVTSLRWPSSTRSLHRWSNWGLGEYLAQGRVVCYGSVKLFGYIYITHTI